MEVVKECIKKYKGQLVCPKCATDIELLPSLNFDNWYAYRCLCHYPLGWGYVQDLRIFNGWTHLARLEKLTNTPK